MIFALGAFDGFHAGHRLLLSAARERAHRSGTEWGVITFEGHPQMLFNKDGFKLLFTPEERDVLIKYFDIPVVSKISFTRAIADMTPESFIDCISDKNDITGLVIGENFRFGRARTGTPELLGRICAERDWSLDVIPSYMMNGIVVSSTAIRDAVMRGQMQLAREMLGYPFMIQGRVIKGDGRGKTLGYPTANISVKNGKVYPARGSYAALAYLGGKWHGAALNIGYNPTFDGIRGLRCEVHIICYSGSLYDRNLSVFVIARNREEMKFSGPEALSAQLKKDMRLSLSMASSYKERFSEELKKFESLLL
ncbi:MAG: riboflavin biosynthesis protein RibF [Synergistaceae bacterium]|nr:riboflavin biosynthesis protein RibF [Synergistaceae bacterium]